MKFQRTEDLTALILGELASGFILLILLERKREANLFWRFQREIEAADRQIDQLVYGLYGLTEEAIKIVEEAVR